MIVNSPIRGIPVMTFEFAHDLISRQHQAWVIDEEPQQIELGSRQITTFGFSVEQHHFR